MVKMTPLSKHDKKCLMTLEHFIECCECGGFIDYDGFGLYATETEVSDVEVEPSDITCGDIRREFTHVCWYNK